MAKAKAQRIWHNRSTTITTTMSPDTILIFKHACLFAPEVFDLTREADKVAACPNLDQA
jgi:hypothetical protein